MSQRFTEGLAGILFYGLRKNMLVSKLMGHKEQEIWVEYESETKTVYGQPLYYKLFTMCQRKHTHENHNPQERDRGEGGKKASQTSRDLGIFLAFLGKLFVQKLPAPQQPFIVLTEGVSSSQLCQPFYFLPLQY